MEEFLNQAWVQFTAIAAGVAVVAGFITNAGKLKNWAKAKMDDRRKRKNAPAETLALVKSMQVNVQRLEGTVTNVITKVNSIEGHVTCVSNQVHDLQAETSAQSEMLTNLDADTADLLASQLTREHDYFVKKGFCPTHDKQRIGVIYNRYRNRGRNHIAEHLLDDIINLPISGDMDGK